MTFFSLAKAVNHHLFKFTENEVRAILIPSEISDLKSNSIMYCKDKRTMSFTKFAFTQAKLKNTGVLGNPTLPKFTGEI